MAPQSAGHWGSGVAFSVAIVGAGPTPRMRRRGSVAISAFLVGLSLSAAPANAACAPDPAFSSGQTVTCSGNTPAGFQAGGLDNLTVNVLAGATVNGSVSAAIGLNDANTVTNWGTVTAGLGLTGIEVGSFNTSPTARRLRPAISDRHFAGVIPTRSSTMPPPGGSYGLGDLARE